MKLQLALDTLSLEDALDLAKKVADYVDIFEIGTPLVIDRGMDAVRALRGAFPDKEVLSDEKIMDGGYYETQLGIEAGADYVTVMALADPATIRGCVSAANELGGKVLADLLCVDDIPTKVRELEALGVHVIAVHTGADQQTRGRTPLADLELITAHVTSARVAVAGGINSTTIATYVPFNPDIIIVGSGIVNAPDPVAEARAIRELMPVG
jgi:3-hexulose-6-phosphate synthase